MSIVDPDISAGAGASGKDDSARAGAVAHCPHCDAPVGDGVFPWPPEPTRCPACAQWIGRNRANPPPGGEPAVKQAAPPAPEAREPAATDAPPDPAELAEPPDAAAIEEPPEPATMEAPPEPAAIEEPPEPAAIEEPPEPAAIEEPPDEPEPEEPPAAAALDAPPEPSAMEAPPEPPAIEEPPEAAADEDEPAAAEVGEEPPSHEARTEVPQPAADRAASARRSPRGGSLMRRSRMRRLMSTFGLAAPPEGSAPASEPSAPQPSAADEDVPPAAFDRDEPTVVQDSPADRDAVMAEVDDPDAFAHEQELDAAAEPDFEAEEPAPVDAEVVAEDEWEPPATDAEPEAAEDEPAVVAGEDDWDDAPAAVEDEPAAAVDEPEDFDEAEDDVAAVAEPDDFDEAEDDVAAVAEPEEYEEAEPDVGAVAEPDEYDEADDYDEPVAEHEPDDYDEPEDDVAAVAEPEPEPEPEDDEFADEDDRQRALRTVAAQVAVARLASAKPAPSRIPSMPSLPRRPQKLGAPRVTLPRRRPAPEPSKPSPIQPGVTAAPRRGRASRYAGITMVAVGLLILAYGTVTLVWQDPWTAWQTARAQKRAEVQYKKILKDFKSSTAVQTKQAKRAWLHRQAALFNLNTPEGSPVGRLSIPKIDVKFTIVQGTEESTLSKGPAHYVETPLPGAKGKWTVGIAGHRTTYLAPFRRLNELDPGDRITIAMPYARFYYTVEKTKIVDATDQTVLAADSAITGRKPYNRLALTACHPPFSAAQRIIVYSRLMYYRVNDGRRS